MTPVDWSDYPDDWEQIRQRAVAACGGACQGCGATHREDGTNRTCITVHHPDRDPPNRHARLTVLCASCHLAVESIARRRQKRLAGVMPGHADGQLEIGEA